MTKRKRRRDPSEQSLTRRRPPELYTLYSKDLRIDIMVGSPRISFRERRTRQPFERERPEGTLDQPTYVHYFPARVRISWASMPKEKVIMWKDRDLLVESVRELSIIPRGAVWDAALEAVESYVHDHPAQRQRYVDYDPASRGINVSWEEPTARHMLASGGARVRGQGAPRAVKLRIKLLLDQAETSTGFRAESAREKAESLIREYGLTPEEVRALESEFRTRGRGEEATRPLLGGREETRPLLGRGEEVPSRRLPPKRDGERAAYGRARDTSSFRREIAQIAIAQGWRVEQTEKGHWRFIPPDKTKRIVIMPGTSVSRSGTRNALADLRRSGLVISR